jgi:hypothetical protein
VKSGDQPEHGAEPDLDPTDADLDAAQPEAAPLPEKVVARSVQPAASHEVDSPAPIPVAQAAAPAAIQLGLASLENGAAPEVTQPIAGRTAPSKAESPAPEKPVRKRTTRKKLNQPPPEEASGLSNG